MVRIRRRRRLGDASAPACPSAEQTWRLPLTCRWEPGWPPLQRSKWALPASSSRPPISNGFAGRRAARAAGGTRVCRRGLRHHGPACRGIGPRQRRPPHRLSFARNARRSAAGHHGCRHPRQQNPARPRVERIQRSPGLVRASCRRDSRAPSRGHRASRRRLRHARRRRSRRSRTWTAVGPCT